MAHQSSFITAKPKAGALCDALFAGSAQLATLERTGRPRTRSRHGHDSQKVTQSRIKQLNL
jgi:hypothetical protein